MKKFLTWGCGLVLFLLSAQVFAGDVPDSRPHVGNVYANEFRGNWQGNPIGAAFGGAGTISGMLKANGAGVVSAGMLGTDYVGGPGAESSGFFPVWNGAGSLQAGVAGPASGTLLGSVTAPAANPITGVPSITTFLRGDGTWASTGASQPNIPVRQTVLAGDTTSGVASFLTTGTGLTPAFTTTSGQLTLAFANGFGSSGAVDYVSQLTSGGSLSALPASNTSFLFATYVSATSVTWGSTIILPVYDYVAPTNTNGQYWFDIVNMQMKLGNGTTWTVVNVVFVGEAVTGASTVTSVTSYALQGTYASVWGAVGETATNTAYSFTHNLGISMYSFSYEAKNVTAEFGFSTGDIIEPITTGGSGAYGTLMGKSVNRRRNSTILTTGNGYTFLALTVAGAGGTPLTAANWLRRVTAKRNF